MYYCYCLLYYKYIDFTIIIYQYVNWIKLNAHTDRSTKKKKNKFMEQAY